MLFRSEIIKLRQRIDTTFIYVTHDQTEAMTLGDRIVIMKDGEIQQIGTPQEVFNKPVNLFVAGFIGMPQMNFYAGKLLIKDGRYVISVQGAEIIPSDDKQERLRARHVPEMDITVGARPEHITLEEIPGAMLEGTVDVSEMMGSSIHLHVNAGGHDSIIIVPTLELGDRTMKIGEKIRFTFAPNVVHMFDRETGRNLEYTTE